MLRLGIIGGTFDPIHAGHVLLALYTAECLPLDEVLFMPAADPPHKERRDDMASAEDRWEMVRRAVDGFPAFAASRIELDRPGKSYTAETLQQLRSERPGAELFLIIGEDNVSQLCTWHDPRRIVELCTVVAGSRTPGAPAADCELARHVRLVPTPLFQISSTEVRRRVAAGLPVRYLVPEAVEAYIRERGLYGTAGAGRPALTGHRAPAMF